MNHILLQIMLSQVITISSIRSTCIILVAVKIRSADQGVILFIAPYYFKKHSTYNSTKKIQWSTFNDVTHIIIMASVLIGQVLKSIGWPLYLHLFLIQTKFSVPDESSIKTYLGKLGHSLCNVLLLIVIFVNCEHKWKNINYKT